MCTEWSRSHHRCLRERIRRRRRRRGCDLESRRAERREVPVGGRPRRRRAPREKLDVARRARPAASTGRWRRRTPACCSRRVSPSKYMIRTTKHTHTPSWSLSSSSSSSSSSLGVLVAEWLSHLAVVQEVRCSNPGAPKVLGSDGMIVNIYLYEFILCLVCVRIPCFGLY